jgi:hypothetical protein
MEEEGKKNEPEYRQSRPFEVTGAINCAGKILRSHLSTVRAVTGFYGKANAFAQIGGHCFPKWLAERNLGETLVACRKGKLILLYVQNFMSCRACKPACLVRKIDSGIGHQTPAAYSTSPGWPIAGQSGVKTP